MKVGRLMQEEGRGGPEARDIFVARQPIFDRAGVVGYELLFRQGLDNAFPAGFSTSTASAMVIKDALLVFGFDVLTRDKIAFVNVTSRVLEERLYTALPPGRTVLELLETESASPVTVQACREAKRAGYRLALDDFEFRPDLLPLVELADIVKVDFLATTPESRKRILDAARGGTRSFLAEKVETQAHVAEAQREGFAYYQGYFFARPEMVSRKERNPSKVTYLRLMSELQHEELSFERLEAVIRQDVSLSVKLLRYLNSAAFGWRSGVSSLRRAMVLLGERAFRQWATLVAVIALTSDRPDELALASLTRARFCELVAGKALSGGPELDAFLVGLLSLIDVVVGRPTAEVLHELAVHADIQEALTSSDAGPLSTLLALSRAYERGSWGDVHALTAELGVKEAVVRVAYLDALRWAGQALGSVQG
jgi:c-di-GMP-related signal transduction protein